FERRSLCRRFEAGAVTTYSPPHRQVYVFDNTTAWVEARWGNQVRRTPNHTLHLNEAGECPGDQAGSSTGTKNCQTTQNHLIFPVKLDPPPTGMPFSKTGGQLRVRVPRPQCQGLEQPPQHQARFWRAGDGGWTQVQTLFAGAGKVTPLTVPPSPVTCALGVNGTFVVQLRHKPPHWSSYWSDWSNNISVPEEILRSPELSHQLGKLGRDGQRVLRLSWQVQRHLWGPSGVSPTISSPQSPPPFPPQPVLKEHRGVTYKLEVNMLACGCAESDEEDTVALGGEVTEHNLTLSGAEYQILLTALNAAGPGPAQQLRVPAEQRAGTGPSRNAELPRQPAGPTVRVRQGHPHPVPLQTGSSRNNPRVFVRADSLAVPFNISAGGAAAVLRWEPSPRAACPGALAKYRICHTAEGDNVTYSEVDATASNYTLQNLQPGTGYRVGVWEVTEDGEGTCSAWWPFQTKALGPQGTPWRGNLKYLGISLGLPAAAAIYHLSKKRARRLLFPPLPKPVGTKAIQFSAGESSQGQPRPGLLEPSERFNPAELLLTEPNPSEETSDTGTQAAVPHPEVSQPGPALEKPAAVAVSPAGCGEELPFAYRRQEMLSPVGSPPPGSTNCAGHPPGEEEEEEEEGRQGLHQPLIPIALLISDKPIIIRGEEGWDPSPDKPQP
ncbi:I12R1 protein, partial [Chloropsis cyanopogon]|nr:I12R1 protein [Chloropsis cyanopogon]